MARIRLHSLVLIAGASLLVLPGEAEAQKRQRDRITREEIMTSVQKDMDLYLVIKNLRPQFLEPPRGVRSMGNSMVPMVALYVNARRESGLDALRSIAPSDVQEVRYLDATQAGTEFGPSASSGAIIVKLCGRNRSAPSDDSDKSKGC